MAITKSVFDTKGSVYNQVHFAIRAETNNASAPDGADPSEVTWAYSSQGVLTATLPAGMRPAKMLSCHAYFMESDLDLRAVVVSYVASTGVITIHTQKQTANTVGNEAGGGMYTLQNTTDKTLVVECLGSDFGKTAFQEA